MRKAFTLIELLVVIAIIAILAAILFPVFAQAKASAKKTTTLSNQKQIGAALQMYLGDHDGTFARADYCSPNSSLNSRLNNQAYPGDGCDMVGPAPYRVNAFSWQKFYMPYVKSVELFESAYRTKHDTPVTCPDGPTGSRQWSQNGRIMNGLAINLGLTGATDTYNRAANAPMQRFNSWLGGKITRIPSPSEAMITFESPQPCVNFAPIATYWIDTQGGRIDVRTYPMAMRQYWAAVFNRWQDPNDCNTITNQPNPSVTITGGITVGFADGSARFVRIGEWLDKTPVSYGGFWTNVSEDIRCGVGKLYHASENGGGGPFTGSNQNFPFWAIQPQNL
jgi:prepilin-type N-terminal cleavage/methylation domain-containing protein